MKGQDLKHRITGARETVQITRAMQLISTSKMSKSEKLMEQSREFLSETEGIINRTEIGMHPFYETRENNRTIFIVVAANKGLCGDYNHRVLNLAEEEINNCNTVKIYAVGQYCREHFNKKGIRTTNAYVHMMHQPFVDDAALLADEVSNAFVDGICDCVKIIFTECMKNSHSSQTPVSRTVLPLEKSGISEEKCTLEFKSDIDGILKQYIWAKIYYGVCSSFYTIDFKRMIAMQQATTNGEKLVSELEAKYNHLRQESITSELLDANTAKLGIISMSESGGGSE